MGHALATYKDPSSMPDISKKSTVPPLKGFHGDRKKRETILTEDEMIAAGLPPLRRDYCGHWAFAFEKCKREHFIAAWSCYDIKHAFNECQRADQRMRIMDYERERRYLAQQQVE